MAITPVVQIGGGYNSTFNLSNFNFLAFNATSNVEFLEVEFVENVIANIETGYDYRTNISYSETVKMSVAGNATRFIAVLMEEAVDSISAKAVMLLQGFTATEVVESEIIGHIIISLKINYAENITADIDGRGSYTLGMEYAENVSSTPITAIMFLQGFTDSENVTADCYLTDHVNLKQTYSENVSANVGISQDVDIKVTFEENITGNIFLSQEVKIVDISMNELVTASVSVDVIEEKICYLDIVLAPGQKLVIDADTYNVYLDEENVVWAQRGEWLDELSRNTVRIDVIAASGTPNIKASILYTERYL